MLKFLPKEAAEDVLAVECEKLSEVRIRANKKIAVTYISGGEPRRKILPTVLNETEIDRAVFKLCNFSIASAEEQLKRGYIISSEGERVGICGEGVESDGKITAFKRITSLCVRFPRQVKGCAEEFFLKYIKKPSNCLVFSPPFHGKTTFIRDLGRLYSVSFGLDTLFIDERGELSLDGYADLGESSDIFRNADKTFCLVSGVRSMNPQAIVCDEIMTESDCEAVRFAVSSGVKLLATVHSDDLLNLVKKQEIKSLLREKIFDYIVGLKNFKVERVYDGNLKEIC